MNGNLRRKKRKLLRATALSVLSFAFLAPDSNRAHAQVTSASDADRLQEIVVTARKRKEDVQKISDPITVVTADVIERADVQNIQDIARLTPNLVIFDQLVPGIQNVSFRGFTTVQGGQSPFTVVLDGVEQSGQEFLKQQLVDIDQVEILRGPQGTLFGEGAIAGAINITTKQPTNDFSGMARLGFFEGNDFEGQATVSGPIVKDKVFFRVSAFGQNQDGLIPDPSAKHSADFIKDHGLQGQALFKPTDNLTVDFEARWLHGFDGALWLVAVPDAQFDQLSPNPNENTDNTFKRDLQTYSMKVDYTLPWFTITSISAYQQSNWYAEADGDFTPAPVATQDWIHATSAKSEELRLTSPDQGPLHWNAGFYYRDYDVRDQTDFYIGGADYADNDSYASSLWALYGQASYDFTDQFQALVGLRYDEDSQRATNLFTGEVTRHTFSEPQPKVTLTYRLTPDILGYFTYSKGFRTGGFNPNSPLAGRLYNNETADNFEGGLKSEWLNHRLIVNATAFHDDFTNQQFFFSEATLEGIFRAITNIPQTEVTGTEFEVAYKVMPGLTVQGSMGYNGTSIEKYPPNAVAADPTLGNEVGNRTPQVYAITSTASIDYTVPLSQQLTLVNHFDWNHRGDVYWDFGNTLRTGPRDFFNLRVALDFEDLYSVAFVGRNITSTRTPAAIGFDAKGTGESLASYNEPRQLGVELQAKF